ncbi:hypothetical protein D6C89_09955 [Aureobasidium pullulans]|uniref:Integral membrane protein n=1 Tax=Aureobasidium pullulans TaxID=5580 RepID=A0AB74IJW8_AURPU|nr:hypothetical protein D6D21_09868 [Aureobasidium pullulans]THZ14896.1 hypothetical protein D6C89_09955 [Aureobasidium pullulans]
MSGRLIEMNASPWLWIETTWVIIFSALDLALRIIVRSHEYGFEDTLLVLAFRFAMASFGCIYQALYDGLGISPQSLLEARTLRIAKLCLVLHCREPLEAVDSSNVIQDHLQRYYARQDAYHSFSQCGRPHHRLDNISCRHLGFSMFRSKTGLEAILVISILIESFIFLLSSYLFGRLNMKVQNELTVVTIFGMRLPLVLISAYFLVASKRYTTQNNPSDIIYGTALYWQIALVGHSVLATAIQPLKRAATSFSTHSNMLVGNTSQGSMSGKSSKLRSSNKTRRSLLLTETPPTPLSIIWSSAQAGDRLQDSDSIESHPLRIISL